MKTHMLHRHSSTPGLGRELAIVIAVGLLALAWFFGTLWLLGCAV